MNDPRTTVLAVLAQASAPGPNLTPAATLLSDFSARALAGNGFEAGFSGRFASGLVRTFTTDGTATGYGRRCALRDGVDRFWWEFAAELLLRYALPGEQAARQMGLKAVRVVADELRRLLEADLPPADPLARELRQRPKRGRNRFYDAHLTLATGRAAPFYKLLAGRLQVGIAASLTAMADAPEGSASGAIARRDQAPSHKASHYIGNAVSATNSLLQRVPRRFARARHFSSASALKAVLKSEAGPRFIQEGYPPATPDKLANQCLLLLYPDSRQRQFMTHEDFTRRVARRRAPVGKDPDEDGDTGELLQEDDEGKLEKPQDGYRYLRGVMPLERYVDLAARGVLSSEVLARLLAWAQTEADHTTGSAAVKLSRFSRLVLVDLAITLGWDVDGLAQLVVGPRPDSWHDVIKPILCPADGCIYYAVDDFLWPQAYCPPGGQASGRSKAIQRWGNLWAVRSRAYVVPSPIVQLRLSPAQFALVSELIRRNRQLKRHWNSADGHPSDQPLFTGQPRPGSLKPWSRQDTQQLWKEFNHHLQTIHPGWPAVRGTEFARTYQALSAHTTGQDPVTTSWIRRQLPLEDRDPRRYTLVDSTRLAAANARTDTRLRQTFEREFKDIGRRDGRRPPTPVWRRLTHRRPRVKPGRVWLGSWRHPRVDRLRAVFVQLRRLAEHQDPEIRHNALVCRAVCGLTWLTAARPFEVCRAKPVQFDFEPGLATLSGKNSAARENLRLPPILSAGVVQEAIAASVKVARRHDLRGEPAFVMYENGAPRRISPKSIDKFLAWVGESLDQDPEEVFDWYSLRHACRTRLANDRVSYEIINYVMGHVVAGREGFSPYSELSLEAVRDALLGSARPVLPDLYGEIV